MDNVTQFPSLVAPTPVKPNAEVSNPPPPNNGRHLLKRLFAIAVISLTLTLVLTDITPVNKIAAAFPYDILVIYFCLEILARLVIETGAIERFAMNGAKKTAGSLFSILFGAGALTFTLSCIVNNLAAIFITTPIILRVAIAARLDLKSVHGLFAIMIMTSNLGGAATPIGDFPAIQLMSARITGFAPYLAGAFPLFATTAAVLLISICVHIISKQEKADAARTLQFANFSVLFTSTLSKNRTIAWDTLAIICSGFGAMILAWALIPQDVIPFAATAVFGTAAICIFVEPWRVKAALDQARADSLLIMGGVLAIAALATASGIVDEVAVWLAATISDPLILMFLTMLLACLASALVSAGPAAAATMPLLISLKAGPLAQYDTMLAVGFAAAICAGSSCFMWSATAGPALAQISSQFSEDLSEEDASRLAWSWSDYISMGPLLMAGQLAFAFIWIGSWYALTQGLWLLAALCLSSGLAGALLGWKAQHLVSPNGDTSSHSMLRAIAAWCSIASLFISLASIVPIILAGR